MHRIGKIALLPAAAYILLSVAFFSIAHLPPSRFAAVMARLPRPLMLVLPFEPLWTIARAGSLKIGDKAPDFDLRTVGGQSRVQLSSFRGDRPVALVFGSYT